MPKRFGVRRRLLLSVPAAALLCIVLVAPAQAGSSPGSSAVSGPVTHPDADHMGSTIRAHEPQAPTPGVVRPNALVAGQPLGMDVSNYQPTINWNSAAANGAKFVYTKATEGTGYTDATFGAHYDDAYAAGLIRGAYHFALPDRSSGAAQAAFFVANGGNWSADGMTLPPMLDIEYNPYGDTCYGMTGAPMVSWIRGFSTTVHSLTGRYPTIYSTRGWWNQCTASDATFGATNPLFLACYCSGPGTMPVGWDYHTIWQYNDAGILPGDQDVFNGSLAQLRTFAAVADGPIPGTPSPPSTGGGTGPTGGTSPAPQNGTAAVVPASAEAGGVVGVMLDGWAPNTTLAVTLDGTGRTYSVTTDAAGSGFRSINVPANTSGGGHTVVASAGSASGSGAFQVTPLAPGSLYQILSVVLRFLFGI